MQYLLTRLLIVTTLLLSGAACQHQSVAQTLPTSFEENRIVLVPRTTDGRVVRFVTDTGGGWNAIKRSVVQELALQVNKDGETVNFPTFSVSNDIPSNPLFENGNLVIVDDAEFTEPEDGFLGGRWFGNKMWEFDYPNQTLSVIGQSRVSAIKECHVVELGFQTDEQKKRTMHFARMPIEIDGQVISVLLDTGAKTTLSDSSAAHLKKERGSAIGTSFIVWSVFNQWVERHPEWTVLLDADSVRGHFYAMIEVPQVTVGGHTVGPVWFVARPDNAFLDYMSSMMDQTVQGALGGSGLQYFRLIVDYPNAAAHFCVA